MSTLNRNASDISLMVEKVPLTHRSLLIGEERCAVSAIHVGHAYVVSIRPVQFPGSRRWC